MLLDLPCQETKEFTVHESRDGEPASQADLQFERVNKEATPHDKKAEAPSKGSTPKALAKSGAK